MKYQLFIPVLLTAAVLTGCGSQTNGTSGAVSSASKSTASPVSASSAASSAVSSAASSASGASSDTLSGGADSTYTDSELASTLSTDLEVLSGDAAVTESGGSIAEEYPDDDTASTEAAPGNNADKAPTVDAEPAAGKYDSFIQLADYKNLSVEAPDDTVIADGMTVNIDYTGKLNGKPFDGGSDTGFDLVIGSGSFVKGFEDQLIGHKKGDSFTIDIKFPSDYEETSLAGQTAQFDVKINRVYSSMTPDLAVSGVVDGSKVLQYPKKMEDEWKDSFLTQFRLYSTDSTSDASALLKENGYDEAGFMDLIHTSLKQDLVYQAILDREGITKDSDEYKKMTETVLKGLGFSSASDAAASGVTEQELRLNTEEKLVESIVVRYEKK